jgi:hypothetical protein
MVNMAAVAIDIYAQIKRLEKMKRDAHLNDWKPDFYLTLYRMTPIMTNSIAVPLLNSSFEIPNINNTRQSVIRLQSWIVQRNTGDQLPTLAGLHLTIQYRYDLLESIMANYPVRLNRGKNSSGTIPNHLE